MSARQWQPLWPKVEPILKQRQPSGRLSRPNAEGWIGPICSPLREDRNPSFSVKPDSENDPGAWKDHATGDHDSLSNLAQRLGIDPYVSCPAVKAKPIRTREQFAAARKLDIKRLQSFWIVKTTEFCGRPALRYPTPIEVDRIKYLDNDKPKYSWAKRGGKAHVYLLCEAKRIGGDALYIVNGEPSVWAATEAGVPAVCFCAGEGTEPPAEALTELQGSGFRRFRVVFDLDDAGCNGARKVVAALRATGLESMALELPVELGPGGDVGDLFRQVGSRLGEVLAGLPELGEGSSDDWPKRQSLAPAYEAVPELPVEFLPEALVPWITDVADRASISLEFVAIPTLVALSSVVGRQISIRPEELDDWPVIPNLWGGIVAPPATLKSYALAEALKPLAPLEAKARGDFEQASQKAETRKLVLNIRLGKLKKNRSDASEDEVGEILAEIAECDGIRERRYRTCDATVEKLGELLRDNPRGILLSRDELAGWLRTLEKTGHEGEREFYLEAWGGNGNFTVDRIGRGTIRIEALCASVIGGIQPGKLARYISEAIIDRGGADGLLQRLQLVVWPDALRPYKRPDRWPNKEAKARAFEIFATLDKLDPEQLGAKSDSFDGPRAVPFLRFDSGAQALFNEWREELEARLRSSELAGTPAFQAHLGKYRSLLPSLALLFDLVDRVSGNRPMHGPVALAPTKKAAAMCDFLEAHARKVFSRELSPERGGAVALAARIEAGDVEDGVAVRDLYRRHWSGLGSPDALWPAIYELEDRGWLRVENTSTGGRHREVIRLHPDFRRGTK